MSDTPGRALVLVRHAKAEPADESEDGGAGGDHARPLTAGGTDTAARAGRWLAGVLTRPVDWVWVSSAARTRATWEAMAPSMQAPAAELDRGLYQADGPAVLVRVSASDVAVQIVVGHNPTMEQVLAAVVGQGRAMRPGAVAILDLDAARLVDFWNPQR